MWMKLSFSQLLVFGEDLAGKRFSSESVLNHVLQKTAWRDYLEGSRVYSLEMFKQLQILFLLNVSPLMDKDVDCFFPEMKVDENFFKKSFWPRLGILRQVSRLRLSEVFGSHVRMRCSFTSPREVADSWGFRLGPRSLSLATSGDCQGFAKWELVPPSEIGRRPLTSKLSQV